MTCNLLVYIIMVIKLYNIHSAQLYIPVTLLLFFIHSYIYVCILICMYVCIPPLYNPVPVIFD